jgi:hypothetical protein
VIIPGEIEGEATRRKKWEAEGEGIMKVVF